MRNFKIVPFLPSTTQTQATLLDDSSLTLDGILLVSLVSGTKSLLAPAAIALVWEALKAEAEIRAWEQPLSMGSQVGGRSERARAGCSRGGDTKVMVHCGDGCCEQWG